MNILTMRIAPDFTVQQWINLKLKLPNSGNWQEGIKQFSLRMKSRFILPADILIKANSPDAKVGFAVLAIDFILIEALQGFREGHIEHIKKNDSGKTYGISKGLVKTFLTTNHEFQEIKECFDLNNFYEYLRCNLSHMGQTKGDIRLCAEKDGPLIRKEDDTVYFNRTVFHEKVNSVFERYCEELLKIPTTIVEKKLRENFLKKMNSICGIKVDS